MTEIERRRAPVAGRGAAPAERWRDLPLTPEEVEARRRNRKWLLLAVIPSVTLLVLALISSGKAEHNEPNGPSITVPAGFQEVRDGYYTYAVPAGWSNNPMGTDSTGDTEMSGADGWAGEHIGYRKSPPTLGEVPPKSLEAFGSAEPTPFSLLAGHPMSVPGATVAYEYTLSRPQGTATVVDAWSDRTGVELWLAVHATTAVSSTVLTSLRAS